MSAWRAAWRQTAAWPATPISASFSPTCWAGPSSRPGSTSARPWAARRWPRAAPGNCCQRRPTTWPTASSRASRRARRRTGNCALTPPFQRQWAGSANRPGPPPPRRQSRPGAGQGPARAAPTIDTMRPSERHAAILEIVDEHRHVSVDFLAQRFGASGRTIRSNLTRLARDGRLRKYNGGATGAGALTEDAFSTRIHEFAREKRAVGRRAAALFGAGDSLFIDTGTTTLAFAQELAGTSGMTIITNSVSITQRLARGPGRNRVFLIGGEYRAEASENLGPLAVAQVAQFNAHHAVLTVGAIGLNGLQDYALEEAEIARAMIARAT